MARRVGTVAVFVLMMMPGFAFADPPPTCSCEFCVPDPEAKCKLPSGGVTTCGIFMRSGICLGLDPAPATPASAAEADAAPAEASPEACLEAGSSEAGGTPRPWEVESSTPDQNRPGPEQPAA